jgi:hypothetical protein
VDEELAAAVYGELYQSAFTQMQLIQKAIEQQKGIGFDSYDACANWAKDHLLDLIVFGKAQHQFYHLSHRGEILLLKAWMNYYCNEILFTWKYEDNGKKTPRPWVPNVFEYYDKARINGEVSDGIRLPLYHRDYFTPTGYFDTVRGTFNIAKPFPVAAANTNRNTDHIYTFIQHIAGDCSLHLLAWLRKKMIEPTVKTEVVPIIVSRAQGTGKSTFAEVICKGLFGKDNVLVTDQYDSQSRFNADYADALVVCHEEKEETDRRNPAAAIKSRATATQIRKEYKGVDPVYQDSYTEFIITTNRDVPIKFEDQGDQRRFMVMGADETFTRKTSELADEVFTKLYGRDANGTNIGIPFTEDNNLIAQFKHELFINEDIKNIKLKEFPKTAAYERCFTLPRTNEAIEIDSILRALAPFIYASLQEGKLVVQVKDGDEISNISNIISSPAAIEVIPAMLNAPRTVALCRPIVFYNSEKSTPFAHSIVERTLLDSNSWLARDYNVQLLPSMAPLPIGFKGIQGKYKFAPAARFVLKGTMYTMPAVTTMPVAVKQIETATERIGIRLRVNGLWRPDIDGEFETVNEMKPGIKTLENKSQNVQYMDTFLFEADEASAYVIYKIEDERIEKWRKLGHTSAMLSQRLFVERLHTQRVEAERLFKEGIACRIVYSGGKSYHILIRLVIAPDTIEEYKWLHNQLCQIISPRLTFDPVCADPARLTRAPVIFERTFEYHGVQVKGTQTPIFTNYSNVYDYGWRSLYEQWRNRPLKDYESRGRKLRPVKPEYQDAMQALLYGTFWTDSAWNGRRQRCFFPAYRICRILGYSHDELWGQGGILDGLEKYYRKNEISYWESRESSGIIASIDKDVEAEDVQDV